MNNNQSTLNSDFKEFPIDILDLLKRVWRERRLIIKTSVLFFLIGFIVAILSPVIYTSETSFVPQVTSDESLQNNKLGSLASLAGINLNQTELKSDSYLSPLVYTNIINSEEFSLGLLSEELIDLNADKFTVKEYLLSKRSSLNFNPIGFIKKYTIGLFSNKENSEVNSEVYKNYNFISDEDFKLLNSFKEKFTIELNEKEGYIKVLATDENAFISAQLAEKITKSLQSEIIEIRTNKIKERLEFSKEQYEIKQLEFDILQNELAEFKDSNKNISTARFRSELQKLQSEYELQQNILISLASEYNNNKIKLNKDTPIFSVIDEVSVPNKRTKPRRGLIIIIYLFFGFILAVGFIIFKNHLIDLIKELKD